MTMAWMCAGILAVWRITHLLALEDGPFDVVLRLRRALGDSMLGRMMDCFYCLSLWVALAVVALLQTLLSLPSPWAALLMWPALSGGAVLLERVTQRDDAPNDAMHKED